MGKRLKNKAAKAAARQGPPPALSKYARKLGRPEPQPKEGAAHDHHD